MQLGIRKLMEGRFEEIISTENKISDREYKYIPLNLNVPI
jgi:hypothetical protein